MKPIEEISTEKVSITGAKKTNFEPQILGFVCNWCTYAGADLAGVSRYQFPTNIRLIRTMCSSRVDPAFIFRAFSLGIDGILVGGCHLADCHYIEGNYAALRTVSICKKLLEELGVNPARLCIEWVSASEGNIFARIVSQFTQQLKELGPVMASNAETLKIKLRAAENILPYLKLAVGEKLPLHLSTEAEYDDYFKGPEVERLFDELIIAKFLISQILLCIQQGFPVEKICDISGLSLSGFQKIITELTRKGLLKFDENQRRFVPT